jgi:cytoskeletal protein CcmA (bactofilin family)
LSRKRWNFRKNEKSGKKPEGGGMAGEGNTRSEKPETQFLSHLIDPGEHSITLIGEGISLNGTIRMDRGMVRLDGRVEGTIAGPGLLLIGKKGFFRGEVQVDTLILCGRAEGTLKVSGRTQITSTGTVIGKLRTRHLTVEEGGRFDGEGETLGGEDPPPRS